MALAAIGGDTGGSIRLPASFCGLVGVRVTPGRISRHGMSSLVLTQDTPGPMCRNVEDAARLLDVLVGFDERDEFTSVNALAGWRESGSASTRFQDAVRQPVLEGKRLGVLREAFGSHAGINGVLSQTLLRLESAGTELIDVEIPDLDTFKSSTSIYGLRSKSDINAFCASQEGLKHIKIEELQEAGTYHKSLDLFELIVKGPTDYHQGPHFSKALEEIGRFQRTVASLFAKHGLDAIVYPTCQVLAPKTEDVLKAR